MAEEDITVDLRAAVGNVDASALASFRLCDSCLGRLFAKVGRGMDNASRGIIVRQEIKLEPPGADSDCHVCGGLMQSIPRLAERVLDALSGWEFANFLVGTRFEPAVLAAEESLWSRCQTPYAEPIKAEFNREIGKRVEAMTHKPVEFSRPDIVAVVDTLYESVDLQVAPLHIYGRYRKLARGIPQTRWPCRECRGKGCNRCGQTGMMYPESVEELVGKIALRLAGGSDHRFHGMGREDIDARMLGSGRPFVLEVKEPRRRTLDLQSLEAEINASTDKIEVSGLRYSDGSEVVAIKSARPAKRYGVRVGFDRPVDEEKFKEVVGSLGGTAIEQRTPVRVSHRRADLRRRRQVLAISGRLLSPLSADLEITAEAGTYIKEFVHGDEGRTVPSISEKLGVGCQVEYLDVLEIIDE